MLSQGVILAGTPVNGKMDKMSIDARWMPKDCDGQLKMGFSIIANAFKLKVKGLEEELATVTSERNELQKKVAKMEDTLAMLHRERLESSMLQCQITDLNEKLIEKTVELENATCEHRKKEQELMQDNRRLAEYLRQYKKKASQLETFRRVVVDTIKHEDNLDCTDFPDKSTDCYSLAAHATSNSSNHGDSSSQCDSQGRRLFRHARSCLSVDKFELFLENVRKLNARSITIEEALAEAEKICGAEHNVIFEEFKSLVIRKGLEQASQPLVVNFLGSPSVAA